MATDNQNLQRLISDLKKKSLEEDSGIWKRIAVDLEKPTRQRRVVNLSRINLFTKDNDVIVVPGKVLASGIIDHKLTVAAFNFSSQAKEKILEAKGQCMSIDELMGKKLKGVRIIG